MKKENEEKVDEVQKKVTKKFRVDALDYQGHDMFSLILQDKILFTRQPLGVFVLVLHGFNFT